MKHQDSMKKLLKNRINETNSLIRQEKENIKKYEITSKEEYYAENYGNWGIEKYSMYMADNSKRLEESKKRLKKYQSIKKEETKAYNEYCNKIMEEKNEISRRS